MIQVLPNNFKPTAEQKRRLNNGCILCICRKCGEYYTSKPELCQMYCSKCYRICCGLHLKERSKK